MAEESKQSGGAKIRIQYYCSAIGFPKTQKEIVRRVGFEGGQMPLQRRLPKRGFTNIFRKQWTEVTLAALEQHFEASDEITPATMLSRGVVAKGKRDVVVLGTGELTKALTVSAHRFTKGAREKIERAGGTANVITPQHKPDALVPVSG